MKRLITLIVCLTAASFATLAQAPAPPKPPQQKIVTASQANGVYRFYKSEFRILALGHNKLKVQFDGIYPTPKSFNMGYAMGEALIDGNVATFKPPDTERCEITIVFLPGKLKVTQEGSDADCGFGHTLMQPEPIRKSDRENQSLSRRSEVSTIRVSGWVNEAALVLLLGVLE